jgi:poly(hydroxyalkanoate) depolymerase family esterase
MKSFKSLLPRRWPIHDVIKRQPGLPLDPSAVIKRALSDAGMDGASLGHTAAAHMNDVFRHFSDGSSLRTPSTDIRGDRVPTDDEFASGTFDTVDGRRDYKLFVPGDFVGKRLPMVVMLHGCTQDPDDFAAGTRMNEVARSHGVIVLYPAQAPRSNASKCWNWFNPGDQHRDLGEPALLAAMTRHIAATHDVDPCRIYVAGLSAGGAMAAILGREYPDLYAAVGVHSGLPPGAAHDVASAFAAMKGGGAAAHSPAPGAMPAGLRVPVIVFHGDGDTTVHPANGEKVLGNRSGEGSERIERGADGHAYTRRIFSSPGGRAAAEHWLVHGGAHAWSGGSAKGSYADPDGPDASAEMVRFFLSQSLGGN